MGSARRWVLHRRLRVERWRVVASVTLWHGVGSPEFEFRFHLGRARRPVTPDWVEFEGDELAIDDGFGI